MSQKDQDQILFQIPAVAALTMGSERLRLFFTPLMIIVAHGGKLGTPAVTGSFFGGLSGALESLFRRGGKSRISSKKEGLSPEKILAADKDNFSIGYDEIVDFAVMETFDRTGLTILTARDKFQFSVPMRPDRLLKVIDQTPLKSRVKVERHPRSG